MAESEPPVDTGLPATVLSGFLGAGKTTLVNRVLGGSKGRRVAEIVSDMSGVIIDADLVRKGGAGLLRTDERRVGMTYGCVCCTLRDDLFAAVRRLSWESGFDSLPIEGTAEPLPSRAPSRSGTRRVPASPPSPGSTRWQRWSTR